MPNTYGLRHDFSEADGIFPEEDKILEWLLRDGDGAEVLDMTGREFTLYVLEHPRQPLSEAVLTVEWGSGMSAPEPPYVRFTNSPTLSAGVAPFPYSYRLKRTDSGNVRTVAYGRMPFLSGEEIADQIR